jgi:hypothetical protein
MTGGLMPFTLLFFGLGLVLLISGGVLLFGRTTRRLGLFCAVFGLGVMLFPFVVIWLSPM